MDLQDSCRGRTRGRTRTRVRANEKWVASKGNRRRKFRFREGGDKGRDTQSRGELSNHKPTCQEAALGDRGESGPGTERDRQRIYTVVGSRGREGLADLGHRVEAADRIGHAPSLPPFRRVGCSRLISSKTSGFLITPCRSNRFIRGSSWNAWAMTNSSDGTACRPPSTVATISLRTIDLGIPQTCRRLAVVFVLVSSPKVHGA